MTQQKHNPNSLSYLFDPNSHYRKFMDSPEGKQFQRELWDAWVKLRQKKAEEKKKDRPTD